MNKNYKGTKKTNRFMSGLNMRRIFSLLLLLMLPNIVYSQTYYGKNKLGKLDFINDSICTVSFVSFVNSTFIDTCYFYKNADTIWISTTIKKRYTVTVYGEAQPVIAQTFFIPIIKVYDEGFKSKYISRECCGIYDSVREQIVVNHCFFMRDAILVLHDLEGYRRFKITWDINSKIPPYYAYHCIIENNMRGNMIVFDEFPLLIKNNSLIPIGKIEKEQCWIDNGFYFPKMKKSKKDKEYNIISGHYLGLMGMPSGFECPPKPFRAPHIKF